MKQICRVIFICVISALLGAGIRYGQDMVCSASSQGLLSQTPNKAAAEKKGKEKKAEPVFEGKQMEISSPPLTVMVPAKNWKVEDTEDPANPLILTHANTALIQILTFQSTMTTVSELPEQLNKTFEKQFAADGAKEYVIEGSKDYRSASMSGRRVRAHFKTAKDIFLLDQIYLQGSERVFVVTLLVKKPLYKAVAVDFEGVARSLSVSVPQPSPEPSLSPSPSPSPSTQSPATMQVEEKRNE